MLFLPGRITGSLLVLYGLGMLVGRSGSLILPCRMLGDTGNSCWKEPARDEPCSCSISWRILVEELILYAELLGVAVLSVEAL